MADIFIDTAAVGLNDGTTKADAYNNSATAVQDALTDWGTGDIIYMDTGSSISAAGFTFTCASTQSELAILRVIDFSDDSYPGVPTVAHITTTGGADINFNCNVRWQGAYFDTDDDMNGNQGQSTNIFEDCYFEIDDIFAISVASADAVTRLINCTVEFQGGNSRFTAIAGSFKMTGGIITGTVNSAGLCLDNAGNPNVWLFEGVDMSGLPSGTELLTTVGDSMATLDAIRCDLPTSFVRFGVGPVNEDQTVTIWSSDDAGNDYILEKEDFRGVYDTNTALFLTAGYDFEGTQQLSRVLTPSTDVALLF